MNGTGTLTREPTLLEDIHDAPVLWHSRRGGAEVRIEILKTLEEEILHIRQSDLQHLAVARLKEIGTLPDIIRGQKTHRWRAEHQRSIRQALAELPPGRWEQENSAIIAVPAELLGLIDGCTLTAPESGLQIRWSRTVPEDTIAITSDDQSQRTLLHLAGAGLEAKHLKMYQNIRSTGPDPATSAQICRALC